MDGQTTININGKNVGVKFSVYGIQEMMNVKSYGLPGEASAKTTLAMIWGGIQGYAFAKQTEPEVSFEEVFDWLENIQIAGDKNDDLKKINTAFESSRVYADVIKPALAKQEPDTKKKRTSAK